MLKDILQGKPLRHALHPFLVHFPIGLFVLSFILDVASHAFKPAPALVAGAFYSMVCGTVFALIAAVPGFVDYSDIRRDHKARRIAMLHMILNLLMVGLYALNIGLRAGSTTEPATPIAGLVLSLICLGVLSVSGYLGGSLVYDHGIGVGRHRRETATPEKTIHLSVEKKAPEPEFVSIPGAKALRDGETLRLEIEGQIIVLAKAGREFHAFQEFCTHRFGPLSEGRIVNGEVECPWHRSCFRMQSGAVGKGPAKEPIKTWPVRIEGETVQIGRKPRPVTAAMETAPAPPPPAPKAEQRGVIPPSGGRK